MWRSRGFRRMRDRLRRPGISCARACPLGANEKPESQSTQRKAAEGRSERDSRHHYLSPMGDFLTIGSDGREIGARERFLLDVGFFLTVNEVKTAFGIAGSGRESRSQSAEGAADFGAFLL